MPPILPPQDGCLLLDRDKFANSFAADVPASQAAFMADSQVPLGVDALNGAVSEPAWRSKPSWYLVATDDHPAGTAFHCRGTPAAPRLRVSPLLSPLRAVAPVQRGLTRIRSPVRLRGGDLDLVVGLGENAVGGEH